MRETGMEKKVEICATNITNKNQVQEHQCKEMEKNVKTFYCGKKLL
jgi:hypothetical protein